MAVGSTLSIYGLPIWTLVVVSLWELLWKGIALWRSARGKQLYWYLGILIFNTVGILPILYLLFFQKRERSAGTRRRAKKKVKRSAKKKRR